MSTKLAIEDGIPIRTTPFPVWPPVTGCQTLGELNDALQSSAGKDELVKTPCSASNIKTASSGSQNFNEDVYIAEQIQAVARVIARGKINYHTGSEAKQFEAEFKSHIRSPYALAVSNGTVALEIALKAFDIGPGDEVIVPSRSFIATAGAVVAIGATPVIADIDPATNCITSDTIRAVATPRTKAIIPVHLGGQPADITSLLDLARNELDAVVIEDCAQAMGAYSGGHHVGTISDAGCFSFCQDKLLPLGEGGMITFRDEAAYKKAWSYRDHGRNYDKGVSASVGAASSQFQWLCDSFGTNGRMNEIQGAMGRVALRYVDRWQEQREANADVVAKVISKLDGISCIALGYDNQKAGPKESFGAGPSLLGTGTPVEKHAYYRLYAAIEPQRLQSGWTRDRIIDAINVEGVPCQYGSCALIGCEEAFENLVFNANRTATGESQIETNDCQEYNSKTNALEFLPGALQAHETQLAFFVHPTATQEDMSDVAAALQKVIPLALRQDDE